MPWSVVLVGDTALVSQCDNSRILEVLPADTTRPVVQVAGVEHESGGEGGLLRVAVDDAPGARGA